MKKRSVNIILLNYNGRDLLEKYLPHAIEASRNSHHSCRVSVVDNCSTDDSVAFLKESFPEIKLYMAKENRVLCSFNDYVRTIDDEIVIFLNTDIKLAPDFVDPLVDKFDDQSLFFVAPKECSMEGAFQGGLNRGAFELGFFKNKVKLEDQDRVQYTLSAHGGATDRKKFIELGGYDNMYLPGYVEDLDICYRAWKRGWTGIYEPQSVQFHEGCTTFNKAYGYNKKLTIIHRNIFLFIWKNVTSLKQIFLHAFFVIPRVVACLVTGRWYFVSGFFQAIGRMPQALRKRKLVRDTFVLSDEDVLSKIDQPTASTS